MNKQIILAKQPEGEILESDFQLKEGQNPELKEGEILGKTIWLSMDPALFGRLRDDDSYAERTNVGEVMQCFGIAQVLESKHPKVKTGQFFFANIGMQEFTIQSGDSVRIINPYLGELSWNMSVIGLAGVTAYFGLLDVGKPKRGDTVVVSAAAGSVGMLVGQIAKLKGCRVVGIAGSNEKNQYLTKELGFDAAVNYRSNDFEKELAEACPNGIDVYFDNVSGDLSNKLLPLYNTFARIVICGRMALTHQNSATEDTGMRDTTVLLRKRITKQGFVVIDYEKRYMEAILMLLKWIGQGKVKIKEQVNEGIENAPKTLLGLTKGLNMGKQLLKVAEPDFDKVKGGKFAAGLITSKLFPKAFLASIIRRLNK